jgi:hypothetical protein
MGGQNYLVWNLLLFRPSPEPSRTVNGMGKEVELGET